MLAGDRHRTAATIAAQVGVNEFRPKVLPAGPTRWNLWPDSGERGIRCSRWAMESTTPSTLSEAGTGIAISAGAVLICGKLSTPYGTLFVRQHDDTPLKPGTIHTYHRVLSVFLFRALKWNYIEHNPTERAMITFDLLSGLRWAKFLGLRWCDVDSGPPADPYLADLELPADERVLYGYAKNHKQRVPATDLPYAALLLLEYKRWQDALGDAWLDKAF